MHSNRTSRFWCSYFRENAATADVLPWSNSYRLTDNELDSITGSIQQFQLGEGSNGRRLLRRSLLYSHRAREPHFVRALHLFVKEEQRHSGYLLRFMQSQNIPRLRRHWIDSVFRFLRGLAGLELSLRVLVTAEIIAVPYYRALREATRSPLLRAICARVLLDEAAHLRFQASMLQRLGLHRNNAHHAVIDRAHRLFLTGTSLLVWLSHRRVFWLAGYSPNRLWLEAHFELRQLQNRVARRNTSEIEGNAAAHSVHV